MTKQYSYQEHPITYKVTILGQDVTEYVIASGSNSVQGSLDYPRLQEFRISEATLTLRNPDNLFNPYNSSNFFVTNGSSETPSIKSDGYRSPVKIEAGFLDADGDEQIETIYEGQVLDIQRNVKSPSVRIICSDRSQDFRDREVTDYGLSKKMAVTHDNSTELQGNYPFFSGLLPYSRDSLESTGTKKQALRTEGPLNSQNYQEDVDYGMRTEGGPRTGNPIVELKAPYRNRKIDTLVTSLLDKYGITDTDTDFVLPIANAGNHWSSLGRPMYEPLLSDTDASSPGVWQWPGIVTDIIGRSNPDELYLLVSQTGAPITRPTTPQPKPRIVKWVLGSDTRSVVTEIAASGAAISEECWRFVADQSFLTFYILGTAPVYEGAPQSSNSNQNIRPGWQFGSYNSAEYTNTVNSKVLIHRITGAQTSPVRTTYINTSVSNDLYPQLGHYYHLGLPSDADTFERRHQIYPDSRRNMHLASNGDLYYAYANRNYLGVAKATSINSATSVIRIGADKTYNTNAFDFAIDEANDHVYFAYKILNDDGTSSRAKIDRGDI